MSSFSSEQNPAHLIAACHTVGADRCLGSSNKGQHVMQERMADMHRGRAEVTLRFSFMRLICSNFSFFFFFLFFHQMHGRNRFHRIKHMFAVTLRLWGHMSLTHQIMRHSERNYFVVSAVTLPPPVTSEKPAFEICLLMIQVEPLQPGFNFWFNIPHSSPVTFHLLRQHTAWHECGLFHLYEIKFYLAVSLAISLPRYLYQSPSLPPGSPLAYCGRWGHHHCSLPARSSIISKTASR